MFFPAHINKDGTVQTVAQHGRNTAEIAKKDLCKLGLADVAYLAGLLHDAGKCTDEFRRYIEKASLGEDVRRGSVIHTFAAVRFLLNTYHSAPGAKADPDRDVTAEILSSAIGGHHGLFDCFDADRNCGFTHRIKTSSRNTTTWQWRAFLRRYRTGTVLTGCLLPQSEKSLQKIG